MDGWIKIDRSIVKHWLWDDPIKFQWWIDILINTNYEDSKVNIGNLLIECKRGQCIMSLQTWAKRWKTTKDRARNFILLLEKDGILTHENVLKSTRITVCNYDSYQSDSNASQTQAKRKPNASSPIKEYNITYISYILDNVSSLFKQEYINKKVENTLGELLFKYDKDVIIKAIKWAKNDSFWSSNFLSINKLIQTNKEGVKFIDLFISKAGLNNTQTKPMKFEIPINPHL